MKVTTRRKRGNVIKRVVVLASLLLGMNVAFANHYNDEDCSTKNTPQVSYDMDFLLKNVTIEKIHVYSLKGEEIAEISMQTASDLLCFASMNPGAYMFKVYTPDGTFLQPVSIPKKRKHK